MEVQSDVLSFHFGNYENSFPVLGVDFKIISFKFSYFHYNNWKKRWSCIINFNAIFLHRYIFLLLLSVNFQWGCFPLHSQRFYRTECHCFKMADTRVESTPLFTPSPEGEEIDPFLFPAYVRESERSSLGKKLNSDRWLDFVLNSLRRTVLIILSIYFNLLISIYLQLYSGFLYST